MARLFIFFSFLLLLTAARSQTARDYEINTALKLNDGSFILGQLIQDDKRSVLVRIASGDTVDIGYGYIRKIRIGTDRMHMFRKGKFHYITGDYLNLSFGLNTSLGSASTHVHINYARRYTPRGSLGFGLGLDTYEAGLTFDHYSFLSVYIYGRYYLNSERRRTQPFVSMGLGYGIAEKILNEWLIQEGSYLGGPMVNPTVGLHFSSKSRMKFLLGWNWMVQYNRLDCL